MPMLILFVQCVCMLGASLLVGGLPLMFKSASSGKRLKAISVLGMGILVGAALTIIIPEGVTALHNSLPPSYEKKQQTVNAMGISLLSGFALMLLIESLTPHPPHDGVASPASTPSSSHTPLAHSMSRSSEDATRPQPHHVDSRTPIVPKRLHIRDPHEDFEQHQEHCHSSSRMQGLNATLGLVIHGAADGIALGASSRSGSGKLGLIVFIAVLVHKGPTALGLTTTLLSLGLSPPMIRRRLIIFSLAAPLGAILTYILVGTFGHNVASNRGEVDGLGWWTGIALLFSGGSFLYVATVIQPLSSDSHEHSHHHHRSEDGAGHHDQLNKYMRTGLLVLGMVLPSGLSAIVGDHH